MDDAAINYRNAIISEPNLVPPGGLSLPPTSVDPVFRTPFAGNVRNIAPPLPQPLQSTYGAYGISSPFTGVFGNPYSNYFGNNFGGYAGYAGYGGYGGSSGAYNRFGNSSMNPLDPEARFIQMAEASSRLAFQSIESVVSAIGNIASMLDSTFFALTSSFRAILGVAANFGRLRGVFAQLWHTFTFFKALTFIYRKLIYWLRISNLDPSSATFHKAFAEALNENITSSGLKGGTTSTQKQHSPWPVVAFISFIFTAPYLIMKLLGTVTNTVQEETRNPKKWLNPIEAIALYDFEPKNPNELALHSCQRLLIAPKEIQQTQGLLGTGWGLATVDGISSGVVPINYVKSLQKVFKERQLATSSEDYQVKNSPSLDQKTSNASLEQPKLDLRTTAPSPPGQIRSSEDVNLSTHSDPY